MSTAGNEPSKRIPEEQLDELWFAFKHSMLEQLQKRLTELEAAGETQRDIAERLGRDPAFVNRCIRGHSNMTTRTMHNLARALKTRPKIDLQPLETLKPSNANPRPFKILDSKPTPSPKEASFRDALKQSSTQFEQPVAQAPQQNRATSLGRPITEDLSQVAGGSSMFRAALSK